MIVFSLGQNTLFRLSAGQDINMIPFSDQIFGYGKSYAAASAYNKRFFHKHSSLYHNQLKQVIHCPET